MKTDVPGLFGADDVLSAALNRFYELKPDKVRFVSLRNGVYAHPFLALRAIFAVLCQRVATLVNANRLTTAEGEDLIAYVLSEYDELPDQSETQAYGYATIGIPQVGTQSTLGTLAAGSTFSMPSFTLAGKQYPPASYEIVEDTPWTAGLSGVAANKTVRVRASQAGPEGNTSHFGGRTAASGVTIAGAYDPNLKATLVVAGGGGRAPNDAVIRHFARSIVTGQYGPTFAASLYGALRLAGVKHVVAFDDASDSSQKVVVADESWGGGCVSGSSNLSPFADRVRQGIYDAGLVGFGCKVKVVGALNVRIAISANVALRDRNYLLNTDEITNAIRLAATEYFDGREDWNAWNQRGLKSAISVAHPKILACTGVTVTASGGGTVHEVLGSTGVTHWEVLRDAVAVTYAGPV